jgi:hypothetical protein
MVKKGWMVLLRPLRRCCCERWLNTTPLQVLAGVLNCTTWYTEYMVIWQSQGAPQPALQPPRTNNLASGAAGVSAAFDAGVVVAAVAVAVVRCSCGCRCLLRLAVSVMVVASIFVPVGRTVN